MCQYDTVENTECSELPLPVELISFNANCQERFVSLHWQVAGESAIRKYEIERSNDGINWGLAGSMYPSSSSQLTKYYEYRDFDRANDLKNYYRIKILEEDGTFRYSEIVADNCFQQQAEIKVYPNPVVEQNFSVDIRSLSNLSVDVRITDVIGQSIYVGQFDLSTGLNSIPFNTSDWANGYYNITLQSHFWQWSGKLIKQ